MINRHKSRKSLTLPIICFFGALLTSSFDKFLVVDAGFTFRATQILLLPALMEGISRHFRRSTRYMPPAIATLGAWTVISCVATAIHGPSSRATGYCVWLIFDSLALVAAVQLFDNWEKISRLIRSYIMTFVLVSCFGIVQFLAGVLGHVNLLVAQWWIPGLIPRINGFSYEPSYFATYLLLGWILIAYILEQPKSQWPFKDLPLYFSLISLALVLSTSRMGIAAMLVWGLRCIVKLPFKTRTPRTTTTNLIALTSLMLIAIATAVMVAPKRYLGDFLFLLDGTGVAGTASHSVDARATATSNAFIIFMNNPVIGVGLGGVAEDIAAMRGMDPNDRYQVKLSEGGSIAMECLAGTGLIGIVCLTIYLLGLYRQSLKMAKYSGSLAVDALIKGLLYSLSAEILILQFNQNILRPYLWLHVATLSAVVVYASHAPVLRESRRAGMRTMIYRPVPDTLPLVTP